MAKKGSQLTVRTATEIQGGEFVILGYAGRSYQMTLDELKKFIGIIEADGGSVDLTQVSTDILPLADATKDIGSLEKRWKKVYSTALTVKAQSADEEEVNIHDGGIEGILGRDIQWSIDGSGNAVFLSLKVNGADVATMQYVNNELSKYVTTDTLTKNYVSNTSLTEILKKYYESGYVDFLLSSKASTGDLNKTNAQLGIVQTDVATLKSYFQDTDDVDDIINKWRELEAFLAGQTETSTLADLLSVKADRTELEQAVSDMEQMDARLSGLIGTKQNAISDLATIRSNATNGNTAYGWGDHSKAGYAMASSLTATQEEVRGYSAIISELQGTVKLKADKSSVDSLAEAIEAINEGIADLTTDDVYEGANKYFTNARAVAALSDTLKGYVTTLAFQDYAVQIQQNSTNITNLTKTVDKIYEEYVSIGVLDPLVSSLQGGIDSLWSRDSFDELYAGHLMADSIAAERVYADEVSAVDGNFDSLSVDGNAVIHAGNIASQSVYRAETAGSAYSAHIADEADKATNDSEGNKIVDTYLKIEDYSTDTVNLATKDYVNTQGFLKDGNIRNLVIKNSGGTELIAYRPTSSGAELTLQASHVGLGNVRNVASFSQDEVEDMLKGYVTTIAFQDYAVQIQQNSTNITNLTKTVDKIYEEYVSIGVLDPLVSSLQGGIDSLWSRDSFDELYASHLMVDSVAAERIYVDEVDAVEGNFESLSVGALDVSSSINALAEAIEEFNLYLGDLSTDNVKEGSNKYFTNDKARAALDGASLNSLTVGGYDVSGNMQSLIASASAVASDISKINVSIDGLDEDIKRIDGYCDEFNLLIGNIDPLVSSLQCGIDSLWSRDSFDELYAGHLMADSVAVERMYVDEIEASTAIMGSNKTLSLFPSKQTSEVIIPIKISKIGSQHILYCDEAAAYDLGTSTYRFAKVYCTEVYQSSDASLKDILGDIPLTVEQIANAPAVLFKWKSGIDEAAHVGTIAQYWKGILPEVVSGEEGSMGIEEATLGVVNSIVLARAIARYEKRIAILESEIYELRNR